MDYKKKYEEALENIKKIKAANKDNKELVDFIEYKYPELKESEDARIRKEIIQSIQDNMCVIHKDKCIAWLEKQGEQKPVWSKEDEDNYDTALWHIKHSCGREGSVYNWLKSIKERYTWKPSKEQIEAFEHFVRSVGESGYASPYDNNTKLLYSLLQQLEKLREE